MGGRPRRYAITPLRSIALLALLLVPATGRGQAPLAQQAWDKGEYRSAIDQARGPAAAGDTQAQYLLGRAYADGLGVVGDPDEAEVWLTRAADHGHVMPARTLGQYYLRAHRKSAAAAWLDVAAKAGDAPAMAMLAGLYLDGDGVAKDPAQAYSLLLRAAQAGSIEARDRLTELDRTLPADIRARGQALAIATPTAAPSAPPPASPPIASEPPAAPVIVGVPVPEAGVRPTAMVQLGAYRSRAAAEEAAGALTRAFPVLSGNAPVVLASGGMFRLLFRAADRAAAVRMCTTLGAAKQGCIVRTSG